MIRLEIEEGRGGAGKGGRDDEADRKIERTIAYMGQHLNKPLPVADLAARANISPSHYFALFKRRTGCTPIDFFIRLRIQRACLLLAQTSLNVKEVAAALGYDDQFYFSRVFKSVNRVAPSAFRLLSGERKEALINALLPGAGSAGGNRRELHGEPAGCRGGFAPPEPNRKAARAFAEPLETRQWNNRIVHRINSILHSAGDSLCHPK